MPRKKAQKDKASHPAFTSGIVTFEFWNNDDPAHRDRTLEDVAKEAKKALGIAAYPYGDPDDLERGSIAFAGVAGNLSAAEKVARDVMRFLDEHSPGRAIEDHWIAEEIPEAP